MEINVRMREDGELSVTTSEELPLIVIVGVLELAKVTMMNNTVQKEDELVQANVVPLKEV